MPSPTPDGAAARRSDVGSAHERGERRLAAAPSSWHADLRNVRSSSSAAVELRLPGGRRVAARDDVDDDRGDVVARAALQREVHEGVDAGLTRLVGEQHLLQREQLDDVGEPVRAQQQPIVGAGGERA